jgi:hypothetical protein
MPPQVSSSVLPAGRTSATLRRASSSGDALAVGSILMPSISKVGTPFGWHQLDQRPA